MRHIIFLFVFALSACSNQTKEEEILLIHLKDYRKELINTIGDADNFMENKASDISNLAPYLTKWKHTEKEIDKYILDINNKKIKDILIIRNELKKTNNLEVPLITEKEYSKVNEDVYKKSVEIEFLKIKRELQIKAMYKFNVVF